MYSCLYPDLNKTSLKNVFQVIKLSSNGKK